jgi:ABC-type branched-subunit amino acid transport system ATPase component
VVFQAPTLAPWLSARANAALPLELAGVGRAEAAARADAALARVGLAGAEAARPVQLSGGMAMRVSLARALVTGPRLLLLDEPFAGLGPEESKACIELIRELKREFTILLVEHDMDAVFSLADRVSVLVDGRILATGSPMDIRAEERVRAAYLGDEEFA